jgi:hypothetical protein
VTVSNSTVTGADNLILVEPGANASLAGPLLNVTDSTINTNSRLLFLDGASLTSNTPSPFLFFDPTTVTTGGGSILLLNGSNLSLAGPLLSAQSTAFAAGDPALNAFSFLNVLDGSNVTSTSPAPLLSFDASSFVGANVVSVRRSPSLLTPSKITLSGPLFAAVNGSFFDTTTLGAGATLGTAGGACCSLVSLNQGGQLSSTTTAPLVQLTNSVVNAGPDAESGGSFFNVSDTFGFAPAIELVAPSSVSLTGPLLSTDTSVISALFNLLAVVRSNFSSTTTDPLIHLTGSTVNVGGVDPFIGGNGQSRFVIVSGSATTPASLSLQGPLLSAVNSSISSGQEILGVFNGASLTSSGAGALLSINGGSVTAGTAIPGGGGGSFLSFASGTLELPPSASLAGPLFNAMNATITNGDPTRPHSFMFVGDSAAVASATASPLLSFEGVNLVPGGNVLSLRRSLSAGNPTTLSLAGPLFAATSNTSVNVLNSTFGSTCCSGFFIGQGAQLTSTGLTSLIQLTGSTFNAGPDPQAGGGTWFNLTDTGACCGETDPLVAPSKVTLAGPLLSATNSEITSLFSVLGITRSDFSTSSSDPLIQLVGTTVSLGGLNPFGNVQTSGRLVVLVSSTGPGIVGSPASLSLTGAGPLLVSTNASINTSSDLIGIFNGGTFSSAATVPLVQLNGGTLTTQSAGGFPAYVLNMGSTGGPTGSGFASAQLGGPLLRATGALNLTGGFANVFSGGQVTTTGSTEPFTFIDGGVHTVAGSPTPGAAMFGLSGRNTASILDAESGLTVGTDRPIQGALQLDGTRPVLTPLLQTSGATITTQSILRIDNALLEATAPLLNLTAKGATPSVVTATGSNAIDLSFAARVSSLGSSLIRLDGSVLNINNQHLIVAAGGSKLTVGGDLVSLVNGATLNILNGPLLRVTGDSFVRINGGLINFGGTGGNTVNVTNNICPCSLFGGIPVALQNGALASNVQISSPIKNAALGTLNLSPNAALAVVNGAGSKLIVGPQ